MNLANIRLHYDRLYRDIGFERAGLFASICKKYNPKRVVYVGSSIHVTPSFYFRNVTYADDSQLAQSFFSDKRDVAIFIGENKKYRGASQFEYYNIDYGKKPIAIIQEYDLALSIFAPRSLAPATACVKKGGTIVYLPLPSDKPPEEVKSLLRRTGFIHYANGKYKFTSAPDLRQPRPKTIMRYITGGLFVEKNTYSVFIKR